MSGIIASVVVNYSMKSPEKGMVPSDFMPSLEPSKPKRIRINRKKSVADVRSFFAARIAEQEQRNGQ